MEVLICYLIGVIIGIILATVFYRRRKIAGIIDVDHQNGTCQIHITSDELANRRNTKVIFTINHDANLSREEQGLLWELMFDLYILRR